MSHSVEQLYDKIKVLHDKGLLLHRERYRYKGRYDKTQCQYQLDDIRALAREVANGLIDLDIDFSKKSSKE